MKKLVVLAALLGLLGGCRETPAGTPTAAPGALTIRHGGLVRTWQLVDPAPDGAGLRPLVLVLHGGGGIGDQMRTLTERQFELLAAREGFLVAYPDAWERNWNDGRENREIAAQRAGVDDVGFLAAVIDQCVRERRADPRRVYATGISNGAMMAHRLGIALAATVAAIAPVAGALPFNLKDETPAAPVAVLLINGTDDLMVPWAGGAVRGRLFGGDRGKILGANATAEWWALRNGCRPTPTLTTLPDSVPGDGTRVLVNAYPGGRRGTEVRLYRIEGGGHTWPGGRQYLPELLVGKTCREFNAVETIWRFFAAHPKP